MGGASVHMKDEEGKSALHLAAEGDHATVAQALLAHGRANVSSRDACGQTALLIAANLGHSRTSRVLMRFGANANAACQNGRTPLTEAGNHPDQKLGPWLQQFAAKREHSFANVGKVQYFKGLGAMLPAHVVAPDLRLTPTGMCPFEDGQVKQLPRGIRYSKKRAGPSQPKCHVNWCSPRG